MSYKIETHLHTKEASACASATAVEQVRKYYARGYQGIIVTDHFFNGNTAVPRHLPWKVRVKLFCKGYEAAKAEGDRLGLDVYFGWEAGYNGTEFLIYGLDKQWLLEHKEIENCTVEEQYRLVKEAGGYVFHAHPFREESYIPCVRLYPEYVDGVEVYNEGNIERNPIYNDRALQYANDHKLPMIEGSDAHHADSVIGGMVLDNRIQSIEDFCQIVLNRKGYRLMHETKIEPIVYEGSAGVTGRLEKEMRVYELLNQLQVPFWRLDHKETATIDDCQDVDRLLQIEICKNLFLCNSKKDQYYLLMMPGDKRLHIPEVAKQIPSTRLSFGNEELMEEYLDITPGSVSVLGLMNDKDNKVQLVIDRDLLEQEYVGCHPCINTSSLKLKTEDLLQIILPAIHHEPIFVSLS